MRSRLFGFCLFTASVLAICVTANAQDRPFLFTLVAPEGVQGSPILLHYDVAYGQETFEPLGGDNAEQTLGILAGLNESLTLVTRLGFAINKATIQSSQHAELLLQVLKGQDNFVDFSVGPGFRHEYSGTNVLLARAVAGRRFNSWQIYSNCLLEKPFSDQRDKIDLFLTLGWLFRISGSTHLGFEAVGQDLEGFWVEEEAEGGAVLFIGPTLVTGIPAASWTITLGAGPIVRATRSRQISSAPRDLPSLKKNGFVVHAAINFGL